MGVKADRSLNTDLAAAFRLANLMDQRVGELVVFHGQGSLNDRLLFDDELRRIQ